MPWKTGKFHIWMLSFFLLLLGFPIMGRHSEFSIDLCRTVHLSSLLPPARPPLPSPDTIIFFLAIASLAPFCPTSHHPDVSYDRPISVLTVWPYVQKCPLCNVDFSAIFPIQRCQEIHVHIQHIIIVTLWNVWCERNNLMCRAGAE